MRMNASVAVSMIDSIFLVTLLITFCNTSSRYMMSNSCKRTIILHTIILYLFFFISPFFLSLLINSSVNLVIVLLHLVTLTALCR